MRAAFGVLPMSATDNPKLIPDRQVAKDLGRSLRTLARWDEKPELGFPRPIVINKRKYRAPGNRGVAEVARAGVARRQDGLSHARVL